MEEDFTLIGDFTSIQLDQSGISIVAPGLYGSGTWHSVRREGEMRSLTCEQPELNRAIAESGAEDRHTLLLDAPTPPTARPGGNGVGDVADDELLLQVPLAHNEAAFVMYLDEAGIVSFHYGKTCSATAAPLPSRAFGAAQQVQFRLHLRPGISRQPSQSRALFSRLVSKIIKVLVLTVFPDEVGTYAARHVQDWERKYRQFQGLHGGIWADVLDPRPKPVENLSRLAGRRSLMLIHGTTSTTAGAFARLVDVPELLDRLGVMYEGRILGFNHHTMSASVVDNVRQFYMSFAAAPGDFTFDVVCHCRGGLLARALAHFSDDEVATLRGSSWKRPSGVRVRIEKIIFVATPNAGTVLADPQHIGGFVDRLTNYVNMLPDATLTIASGGLLSLAGAIAEVTLPRLPGLADQIPGSPLQGALAPFRGEADRFYAFCSNYEPTGDLVSVVKDAVMDRIFAAEHNDLVVPTRGVAHTPYFELPAERMVVFEQSRNVHHSAFFNQPEIMRIADWLALP